jgi:hypothetical protein
MPTCEHCASRNVRPFTPERYAQSVGAIVLCLGCQRLTIAWPNRTQMKTTQTELPKAA